MEEIENGSIVTMRNLYRYTEILANEVINPIKEDIENLNIPQKTSDINNDSNFVSSSNITSIQVVDELPEIEEEGVLYLVTESEEFEEPEEPTIEYVEYPQMEMGDISRSGSLSNSSEYTRTSDYVYVGGCSSIFVSNGGSVTTRILCYNENKEFISNWNNDGTGIYSYAHLPAEGRSFNIPEGCKYIKARYSSTTIGTIHITYTEGN